MTLASEEPIESDATTLCKACGLCCTGHLFAWAKLRSTEVKTAASLGLKVLGTEPSQRGFNQPCPLWEGECTIYSSPHYPHFCSLYKCSLLNKLTDERVSLTDALAIVEQTKEKIREIESMLPASSSGNFRERLVHELEYRQPESDFLQRARELLTIYKDQFGVKDLIDRLEDASNLD